MSMSCPARCTHVSVRRLHINRHGDAPRPGVCAQPALLCGPLRSHGVCLATQLLHVAVGLQLCDVVRASQEQRQALVQGLWLDVQYPPHAVRALRPRGSAGWTLLWYANCRTLARVRAGKRVPPSGESAVP